MLNTGKRLINSWRCLDFFSPGLFLPLTRFERFVLDIVNWKVGQRQELGYSWYLHELGKKESCLVYMVWYRDYFSSSIVKTPFQNHCDPLKSIRTRKYPIFVRQV